VRLFAVSELALRDCVQKVDVYFLSNNDEAEDEAKAEAERKWRACAVVDDNINFLVIEFIINYKLRGTVSII